MVRLFALSRLCCQLPFGCERPDFRPEATDDRKTAAALRIAQCGSTITNSLPTLQLRPHVPYSIIPPNHTFARIHESLHFTKVFEGNRETVPFSDDRSFCSGLTMKISRTSIANPSFPQGFPMGVNGNTRFTGSLAT